MCGLRNCDLSHTCTFDAHFSLLYTSTDSCLHIWKQVWNEERFATNFSSLQWILDLNLRGWSFGCFRRARVKILPSSLKFVKTKLSVWIGCKMSELFWVRMCTNLLNVFKMQLPRRLILCDVCKGTEKVCRHFKTFWIVLNNFCKQVTNWHGPEGYWL